MSRTNIELDDDLITQAMQVLGTTTQRDTVDAALRRVVQDTAIDELAGMIGAQFDGWTDAERDAARRLAWRGESAT